MSRKFNTARAYKLAKKVVIGVTVITGLLGLYSLYMLESNSILHQWENYCSKHPDTKELLAVGYSCMSTAFQVIDENTNLMYKSLGIAIFLPTIFFGGTALYKYLFPPEETEKH
jgi:hypothetical protein